MAGIFDALQHNASYLIASFLVLFYAMSRFNTPRSVRSQTSRFQYFGSGLIYMVSNLGLLMFLTWLLGQKPSWLSLILSGEPLKPELEAQLKGIDAPLAAALVLTTLLPSFPLLRDFDANMLRFFHKLGSIPIGAVRWAQRMNAAPLKLTGKLLEDTKTYIANSRRLPDALKLQLQPDDSIDLTRFRYTRNLALYVALGNLSARARFGDDFPDDIAAFEKKMNGFFAQSTGFFALADQFSREQLEKHPDAIENFRSAALDAYEEIRLMLARMLLYSSNGDAEVARKLIDMGFSIERPTPIKMPLNLLTLDMVLVIVLFLIFTLLPHLLGHGQAPVGKAIAIGFLVAVNQSIAAIFALLPKQMWSFADIRCSEERPILAYVISGACAFTVSVPVSFGFYLLRQYISLGSPILPFDAQCKWLLTSTVMAMALAFACDDFAGADHEPALLRWIESATLAALMAFTGWLVVSWLQSDQIALHPNATPPALTFAVLLTALIGALFGATIPFWYRTTIRQVKAARKFSPLPSAPDDFEGALALTGPSSTVGAG